MAANPPSYTSHHVQELYYNDQLLPLATVSNFSGTAEYDELGRVLKGWKVSMEVSCVFVSITTRADFDNQLKSFLKRISQPRKAFEWYVGDDVFMLVAPASHSLWETDSGRWTEVDVTHIDRSWGPKPTNFSIKEITAHRSARVDFTLEMYVTVCNDTWTFLQASVMEEFYWSFAYSFDRNYTATRTINGRYKLRSPLDGSAYLWDTKNEWFPPIPQGFYRDSQDYNLSPDGTELTWTVTDKQTWRTLPRPITDGHAVFKVEQRGATLLKHLSGSFSAPVTIPKQVIAQFILSLIRQKFPGILTRFNAANFNEADENDSARQTREWIEYFSIENQEFENTMSFTLTVRCPALSLFKPGEKELANNTNFITDLFTDVKDINPTDEKFVGKDAQGNKLVPDWSQIDGFSYWRPMTGVTGRVPRGLSYWSPCETFTDLVNEETGTVAEGTTGAPGQGSESDAGSSINGKDDSNGVSPGALPATQPSGSLGDTWDSTSRRDDSDVLDSDHMSAPYITFMEQWSYLLTRNLTSIPLLGLVPGTLVQQTAPATMKVIQVGVAERIGRPPEIPTYAYSDADEVHVGDEYVTTHEPRFLGDGITPVFKTSWSISMTCPAVTEFTTSSSPETGKTRVFFPVDPRWGRSSGTAVGSVLDKTVVKAPEGTDTGLTTITQTPRGNTHPFA